jgi:DNA polymerase-3 subunit delta
LLEHSELEVNIKKGKYDNCYVFCGSDEALIKESVGLIADKVLDGAFKDLNYFQYDGMTADIDTVINACETIPFMSDRKVVVIFRADFLSDGEDKEFKKKYESLVSYKEKPASHCILIAYYVFENDREKPRIKLRNWRKRPV